MNFFVVGNLSVDGCHSYVSFFTDYCDGIEKIYAPLWTMPYYFPLIDIYSVHSQHTNPENLHINYVTTDQKKYIENYL